MPLHFWLTRFYRQLTDPQFLTKSSRRRRLQLATAIVESLESRRLLSATTITVDVLGDTTVPTHTTLRDAVTAANTDGGGDTIQFAPGLTGIITLTHGVLPITSAMTITGPGAAVLSVSGNSQSQVFNVSSVANFTATISGLTISGGNAAQGGGISNAETLLLFNNTISGNTATSFGGAIYNTGTLTTGNNTISGNTAASEGGGVFTAGTFTTTNDTLSGNKTFNGGGGAILNSGMLTTTNDTVSGNNAVSGGGIYNEGTWNALNTLVIGNLQQDISGASGATSNAHNLINLSLGAWIDVIKTVDFSNPIRPLLADNGGPTQTIALTAKNSAIGQGSALAASTSAIDSSNASTAIAVTSTTFLAVGDLLRIDSEFVLVTAIVDAGNILVSRGQAGITVAAHPTNSPISLAEDQRGFRRIQNDIGSYAAPRTLTVTVPGDTDIAGQTTLRDAVTTAKGDPPGDTIVFASGLTGTITLTQGVLPITNAMTINGPGTGVLAISGNGQSQIFDIDSASSKKFSVSISNLTLSSGNSTDGGAMTNTEILTLSKITFSGNTASGHGGGIANSGTLTLSNDTFSTNIAASGGGVYNSQTGIVAESNDTFTGNIATGNGGGIANAGTLTNTGSTFSQNQAMNGGGVENETSGILKLSNGTLTGNSATDGGGVWNSGTLTISNDLISGNQTSATGGGLSNLGIVTSTGSTISNNGAANGAGVENGVAGIWMSFNDTISGNAASANGGGVDNAGTMNSTNDTYSGNIALDGGGFFNSGTLATTHVTVAGNSGSGIDNHNVWNSSNTIVAGNVSNSASSTSSDVINTGGTINSTSTLIGDAKSAGGIAATNGNIIGSPVSAIFVTDVTGNPLLANNGGPTQTIALAPGSPAIGHGSQLASVTSPVPSTSTATTISVTSTTSIVVGDLLRIDNEIVLVGAVVDATHITVFRNQNGSTAASHLANASIFLAKDQRGFSRGASDIGSVSAPRTIIVTQGVDTENPGQVSLRDAIIAANSEAPGDVIVFDPSVTGTFTLLQGVMTITNAMTITGPGAAAITISGNNQTPILHVGTSASSNKYAVTITGLTLADAKGADFGGAIENFELLTISHSIVSNNRAEFGAAIANAGTLTSLDNLYSGNHADSSGAISNIAGAIINSTGDTFSGNTAHQGGGAFYNEGLLTIRNDIFSGNSAFRGGAIDDEAMSRLISTGNTFTGNSATHEGGAIKSSGSLFSANDTFANNTATDGGGLYLSGGTSSVTNDTFANNTATNHGGAIDNQTLLAMANCTVSGNSSSVGGGLYTQGTWYSLNTIIVGNTGGEVSGNLWGPSEHNLVSLPNGKTLADVLQTVPNSNPLKPLLANNGGTTQTIALVNGSPAIGQGVALATSNASLAATSAPSITVNTSIFFELGEALRIDNEVVTVTGIPNSTHITVNRAQYGTMAATHLAGTPVFLAFDATGAPRVNSDLGAIAAINHAPVGTSGTVTGAVGVPYALKVADFGLTDPNDTPANALLAVKLTLLPSGGTLNDSGVAVTVGQFVSAADIVAGKLVFTPAANVKGVVFLSKFQVEDNGGTANGGADFDQTAKVLYIRLIVPNHAPVGTSRTVTAAVGTPYTLNAADFGFSDSNDTPQNALLAVKFTLLPTAGTLTDNGTAVTAGQFVTATEINSGKLVFTPTVTGKGLFFLTKFQVEDNGGTTAGGVDFDPTAKVLYINLVTVNHAPVGTSGTVNSSAGTPYTLKSADFGFADPNDMPSNSLFAIKLTLLPTAGTLTDDGTAVTAGQFVSIADINAGKLVFTPSVTGKGVFFLCKFQVQDNGGTANGGANVDLSLKVLDIKLS